MFVTHHPPLKLSTSISNYQYLYKSQHTGHLFTRHRKSQTEVINLSSKKLNTDQISLLKKGLEFVPTRQNIYFTQLLTDPQTWEYRMRLREYLSDNENDISS